MIGFANIPNVSRIGEWVVILNCSGCIPAPYWILELGPINDDGLYDYSIVSDSVGLFLFVLARNVTTFFNLYNDEVLATLVDLGFVGPTKPIPTYQGPDCVYYPDDYADDTIPFSDNSSNNEKLWRNVVILIAVFASFIGCVLLLSYCNMARNAYYKDYQKNSIRESLLEVSNQNSAQTKF